MMTERLVIYSDCSGIREAVTKLVRYESPIVQKW